MRLRYAERHLLFSKNGYLKPVAPARVDKLRVLSMTQLLTSGNSLKFPKRQIGKPAEGHTNSPFVYYEPEEAKVFDGSFFTIC